MNTNSTSSMSKALPVLFGFFVMGFCDVVGIATSYAKDSFQLTETVAGLIPSMVFIWFLFLSIPTAMLMNKIGRKTTVQLSNAITIIGMLIPLIYFNFYVCMVAFALLGIGNTILQVSLNPLLTNVVSGKALTSSLTTGQVVKAVSSFCGPLIAAFAFTTLGNWKFIFPIFAGITLLSSLWLMATPLAKEENTTKASSFADAFGLLKNKTILLCFLGIVFVVGVDVGTNTVAPKLLMEHLGCTTEFAGKGSMVYFLCRTAGAFLGAFLLARMADLKYFRINIFLALASVGALFFMKSEMGIFAMIGAIGFFCSSIFAVIFSQAMKTMPTKANEISGLMITGVFGGALAPPAMGFMADKMGSQAGSLIVISFCMIYLLFCSIVLKEKKA